MCDPRNLGSRSGFEIDRAPVESREIERVCQFISTFDELLKQSRLKELEEMKLNN